jgi:phenylacetate-CoA ligase
VALTALALKKRPAEHYDRLETRSPKAREAALMAALPKQVAHAKRRAPGFARIFADIKPEKIKSRAALAALPVTRKSDLAGLQAAQRPLGGLNATPVEKLAKIFMSPGPIYEPEGKGRDWWRSARALFASGFRAGDLVANTFAYHFTPAGSMLESGALALGCTVVPAGVGQTELQVAAIRDLGVTSYIGTPSFLKLIAEKADEMKADISSLKKAHVGAEYLPPALRQAMRERGIHVLQSYGSADLGSIAYESMAPGGGVNEGMILDEGLLLEIVRPGTGDPVPPGEVGEVVITTFNRDYPLVRFGTGDLSAILPGVSPCGRTNTRIRGWMGRADQSTKVRAMFVTAKQVDEIARRHKEVLKARLVIEGEVGSDRMTLRCEAKERPQGLVEALVNSIRDVTKLRGEAELVAPGTLPNDGKVIEDLRKYG